MTEVEEADVKNPFDRLTRKAAVVVMIFAVVLYFVFDFVVGPARGRAASISAAMIVTVVWMRWDLRKRIWFWLTIAIVGLLHVPLVMFIPWTNNNYPGMALLPEALADLAIVYGCVKVIEKLMDRGDDVGRSLQ